MSVAEIADIIARTDDSVIHEAMVEEAIHRIRCGLRERRAALDLSEVGIGWELRTRPEYAPYVHTMFRKRPSRLSRAALEVLAIVA